MHAKSIGVPITLRILQPQCTQGLKKKRKYNLKQDTCSYELRLLVLLYYHPKPHATNTLGHSTGQKPRWGWLGGGNDEGEGDNWWWWSMGGVVEWWWWVVGGWVGRRTRGTSTTQSIKKSFRSAPLVWMSTEQVLHSREGQSGIPADGVVKGADRAQCVERLGATSRDSLTAPQATTVGILLQVPL
jgi:hypothetical protein